MTLRLNGSTSGYTEIDAPAVAGSNTLVLPTGNGTNGQYLQTNGSGVLSWATVAGSQWTTSGSDIYYTTGKVGIGVTNPSAKLQVNLGTDKNIWFHDHATNSTAISSVNDAGSAYAQLSIQASPLILRNGTSEAMRVDTTGSLVFPNTSSNWNISSERPSGSNQGHVRFVNGTTQVGSITTSTTSTAYNTTSDYRLKENVIPLTGAIERLQQIPVYRFNFIADPDKTVDGFLAHEAQAVVPECVTGAKDEVDADGNPVYQGIDQSKLVPLLTAALQEALAEIENLKASNAALESRIAALEVTP